MAKDPASLLTERPESDVDVEVSFDIPEVSAHLCEATSCLRPAQHGPGPGRVAPLRPLPVAVDETLWPSLLSASESA